MDFNSQLREWLDKNVVYEEIKQDEKTVFRGMAVEAGKTPQLFKASVDMKVNIAAYGVSKPVAMARLQNQILSTKIYKEYFQQNFYKPTTLK